MPRFRTHTETTSRTTCAQCPHWVCHEIALGTAQNHALRTGHAVTRVLTKVTTVTPWQTQPTSTRVKESTDS